METPTLADSGADMKSKNGIAPEGKDYDPTASPDQVEDTGHIQPAPAPGLPISEEEYRRLKEEAERPSPPARKRKVSQRKTKDKRHHR